MITLYMLALDVALAAREPPDYRTELQEGAASDVSQLFRDGKVEQAIELGQRFQDRVEPSAQVEYELALISRQLGNDADAMKRYDRALEIDPEYVPALYDRGELLLLDGELDRAQTDLLAAARLRPDHWVVHFRLAEIAAMKHQAEEFEARLTEALRQGFDFRTIVSDSNWQAWAHDPDLGPVIARLIVVYSDESLLDALRGVQAPIPE